MREAALCILACFGFLVSHGLPLQIAHAAVTVVINLDGAREGFNDPSAAFPVGGNSGTSLGTQRLIAFQRAADIWGQRLSSPVIIRIEAKFDPLACDATSAILGAATTISAARDFIGAPAPSTWYPLALANSLAGTDLDPANNDIRATFNSSIGTTCGFPLGWYYGLDGNPPSGTLDFVSVVLHELGHGLGFQSFVNLATGAKLGGFDDIFSRSLENHSTGKLYPQMTNPERVAASQNTGNLHWIGGNVVAASGTLTAGVHSSGHVQMYAPNPQEPNSSVSHFDTPVSPNQLMEPYYTDPNHDVELTLKLFEDLGWVLAPLRSIDMDFDGDGKTDIAVYQTTAGNWFWVGSASGFDSHLAFGGPNFQPVPGDYDSDGVVDRAVYDTTTGNWFIAQTTAGFTVHPSFGGPGYIPVPGDYDGDGKVDIAVYETSSGNWFYVGSTSGFGSHIAFGGSNFIPVPADYDGDGVTDTAVYDTTNGNWFISQTTDGFTVHPSFGGAEFLPFPGDYDGDGRTDIAVYEKTSGNWFYVGSTSGFGSHVAFGGANFTPVPGDYDGDGKADTAVYDTIGNWFIDQTMDGFTVHPSFGGPRYVPVLPQVTILRAMGLL